MLYPENEEAARVYLTVHDQYIMSGMGGPVAINQVAVHAVMELFQVNDPLDCFEKVVRLSGYFIQKIREKEGK